MRVSRGRASANRSVVDHATSALIFWSADHDHKGTETVWGRRSCRLRNVGNGRFSRDGRFLAYVSNEIEDPIDPLVHERDGADLDADHGRVGRAAGIEDHAEGVIVPGYDFPRHGARCTARSG